MHPQKTIGQHPAVEESSKFSFHKKRNRTFPFSMSGQECLKVSGDDTIKRIVLWVSRMVNGSPITDNTTFIRCSIFIICTGKLFRNR